MRQDIGHVHDERTFDRRGGDPFAGLVADFEAAGIVLGQQRDETVVGMRRRSEQPFFGRCRRVVQQAQKRRWVLEIGSKIVRGQFQA